MKDLASFQFLVRFRIDEEFGSDASRDEMVTVDEFVIDLHDLEQFLTEFHDVIENSFPGYLVSVTAERLDI